MFYFWTTVGGIDGHRWNGEFRVNLRLGRIWIKLNFDNSETWTQAKSLNMDAFRGVCWIQTVYSRKARDHAKLSVVQLIIPCGANIEDESFSANRQQCVQGNLELQFTAEATLVIQRRRQRKSRGNLLRGKLPTVNTDVKLRRHAAQVVVSRRELHVA